MGSGLIGTDPFDVNAWSGSSRHFFSECNRQDLLHRAFGVEVSSTSKLFFMLKAFSPSKDVWRQKFYLDTAYYDQLSKAIADKLRPEDFNHIFLQIGGIYNLKKTVNREASIVSYHDGNLAQAIKSPWFPKNVPKTRIKRALEYERGVYHDLDMIFTMSDYLTKSFIRDFNIDARKVRTIGAGINLDSVPRLYDKDYSKKNLLFIGADFYRKGGMDLLRAFKHVRDIHHDATLNIIGPRVLKISSDYSSGVVYHGFLSKSEPIQKMKLEQIMRDSSIFVLPSLYEPFGIAPLEAMAFGIPCILTNDWAFREMVTPGINGELVSCGDITELAEKISTLLMNPDKLLTMGTAARDLVLKRFTWNHVVNNLRNELTSMQ